MGRAEYEYVFSSGAKGSAAHRGTHAPKTASSKGEVGVKSKSTRATGPRSSAAPCVEGEGAKEDGVGVACRDETTAEKDQRVRAHTN